MTDYLNRYGRKQRFQEGGPMPAEGGAPPAGPEGGAPAGPEGQGGGGEEQVLQLAQAAIQGDMEAAAQLGMMLAPMILEQAGGGGAQGGAPAPAEGGAPTFKRGGKLA